METAPNNSNGFSGLIIESIPKRLHKLINIWIAVQVFFGVGRRVYHKYQEKMQYTVTLTGNDDLYNDAQVWLANAIPSNKKKGIRVVTNNRNTSPTVEPSGKTEPIPISLWYYGGVEQTVLIDGYRIKVRNELSETNYVGGHVEEYASFLSERNKLLFVAQSVSGRDAVLKLFRQLAEARNDSGRQASLYISNRWGRVRKMFALRGRSLSSVVLPQGVREMLVDDMSRFLNSEQEYLKMGIPWHRGYLFHGVPGGGKTSLATALASEFNRDVYCIPLSDLDDDTALFEAVGDISGNGVLLLEDIDIIHASRDREDDKRGVSMQGLLNVLDGMLTPHGLVTIMTTNRRSVLDEAVIRKGRIDVSLEVGKLNGSELLELMNMFVDMPAYVSTENISALPADVVGVAKAHIGNKTKMTEALIKWINEQE